VLSRGCTAQGEGGLDDGCVDLLNGVPGGSVVSAPEDEAVEVAVAGVAQDVAGQAALVE
jgi:hypothetical protein